MHGVQNYNKTEAKHIVVEDKVNHDTQFYGIKGGVQYKMATGQNHSCIIVHFLQNISFLCDA